MEILGLTINQIILMFAFMFVGYFMRKKDALPATASGTLSTVLVNVCLAGMVFSTCYENVTREKIGRYGTAVLLGVIMLFAAYFISALLAKMFTKDGFERNVYKYAYTAPNFGYMGYPLVQAVFGDEVLMLFMMFALPLSVFIYTKGIMLLCPQRKSGIKQVILQPTILALVVGTVAGLSGIVLPSVFSKIATTASGCMAPVAMMIAGCVIAEKPIKTLVNDWRIYVSSFVKLVVMPLVSFFVLTLLNVEPSLVLVASALWAMPFGMNTIVFPEAYGGDGRKGAQLAFISHVLGIITLPLIFGIIGSAIV